MAIIGSYGDVTFEVSSDKILSFGELDKSNRPRWSEHAILNNKAKLEFEGPGLTELSYTILLRAENQVNPAKELLKLKRMADGGKAAHFLLGSKPITDDPLVITELSEGIKRVDSYGNIFSVEVRLNLKEYVIEKTEEKKTISSVRPPAAPSNRNLGVLTITTKSVHIRSGPGVNHKVVGYAMKGDKLTVTAVKNGWYALGGGRYMTANGAYSSLKKG